MQRYLIELGLSMVCYLVILSLSLILLNRGIQTDWMRTIVSLLPVLPGLAAAYAVIRQLRRLDEFQIRIQFEAIGFAFAATALVTFTYGFLENVGFSELSMFVVWPVMATFWLIGLVMAHRRHS